MLTARSVTKEPSVLLDSPLLDLTRQGADELAHMGGYTLPTEANPMLGRMPYGHTGRGGSLGFADPDHGITFGYVMNHAMTGSDDARAALLVDAVRSSLVRVGQARKWDVSV